MEITKILDLENDGLNMAVDGQFLYKQCKRAMYKYNLTDMSLTAYGQGVMSFQITPQIEIDCRKIVTSELSIPDYIQSVTEANAPENR